MRSFNNIALVKLLAKLDARENVPLSQFSTIKIGGPARYLVLPKSISEIADLQTACFEHGMDLHILSGGSNTLFSDEGFFGVVVKLDSVFDFVNASSDGLSLTVGAATSFAKVTKLAIARGWAHALGWCGTPGLVGGAIRMNAGSRVGEIKDAIKSVHGILDGKEAIFDKHDIEFGYRHNSLPSGLIVCQATLAYESALIEPVSQLQMKVEEYRVKRKATQPSNNSLGSFFRNPYPLFAAQLIEKCNLKGLKYNSAQISPLHANFIINNGGAFAHDILHIASVAQQTVFDSFGVMLRPEIRMVGKFISGNLLTENQHTNLPNVNLE